MAPGCGIRGRGTLGYPPIPGDGCRIATGLGLCPAMGGSGSQAVPGRDEHRSSHHESSSTFTAPRPPLTPGQTLVVNRGTMAAPVRVMQNRIQLNGNSAGLGVRAAVCATWAESHGRLKVPLSLMEQFAPHSAVRQQVCRRPPAFPPPRLRGAPASRASPAAGGRALE